MWTAGVCARIHYRRTRRQRACSMEQRHCFGVLIITFCEMRGHFNHDEATERIAENVKQCLRDHGKEKGDLLWSCSWRCENSCEAIIRDENPFYRYRI